MGTKFNKAQFDIHGKWAHYTDDNGERHFIARFRTAGVRGFCNHIRKHHTVEDYLGQMKAGMAPLEIAEQTGYLLPHVKKALKRGGYPVTRAGFDKMIEDQLAAWEAKRN